MNRDCKPKFNHRKRLQSVSDPAAKRPRLFEQPAKEQNLHADQPVLKGMMNASDSQPKPFDAPSGVFNVGAKPNPDEQARELEALRKQNLELQRQLDEQARELEALRKQNLELQRQLDEERDKRKAKEEEAARKAKEEEAARKAKAEEAAREEAALKEAALKAAESLLDDDDAMDMDAGAAAESSLGEEQSDEEQPDDGVTTAVKEKASELSDKPSEAQVERWDCIAHQIYAALMEGATISVLKDLLKAFGANAGTSGWKKGNLAVHIVSEIFIKECEFSNDTFIELLKAKAADLIANGANGEKETAAITALVTAVEGIEFNPSPNEDDGSNAAAEEKEKERVEALMARVKQEDPKFELSPTQQRDFLLKQPGFNRDHKLIRKMFTQGNFVCKKDVVKALHELLPTMQKEATSESYLVELTKMFSTLTRSKFRYAYYSFHEQCANSACEEILQCTKTDADMKKQLQTLQSMYQSGKSKCETDDKLEKNLASLNKDLFAMISAKVDELDVAAAAAAPVAAPAPAPARNNLGAIL